MHCTGLQYPLVASSCARTQYLLSTCSECYVNGLMDGEVLLGSLLNLWEWGQTDNKGNRVYIDGYKNPTLEDRMTRNIPRRGFTPC